MAITFNPPLSSINEILIDSSPKTLTFTASLPTPEYDKIKGDGGRIQLWSDIPIEGALSPRDEWTSSNFTLNTNASEIALDSIHKIPLAGPDNKDELFSRGTSVLTLQIIAPWLDLDRSRFSFTYRVVYPSGEIKWLGEFGRNGTVIFEHTTAEITLGLVEGWTCKERVYTRVVGDEANQGDTVVMRLPKPHEYDIQTFGGTNSAFLAFFIARHDARRVSMPPEYILCVSQTGKLSVHLDGCVTVSGAGSLHIYALPHRQAEFHSLILEHCSPERVMVTEIGEDTEHLLMMTKNSLPIEGIVISPSTITARSAHLSIPTNTLRAFLSPEMPSIPFSLFAPKVGDAHLVTVSSDMAFTSAGPFVLSPAFSITTGIFISILSPYKSAQLIEPSLGLLPTPPPSPELVPRPIINHSPSNSEAPKTAAQSETVNIQEVDVQGPLPRPLWTVVLYAQHLSSMAMLFLTTLVWKLLFGMSSSIHQNHNKAEDPLTEYEDELHVDIAENPELATVAVPTGVSDTDVVNVALNQDAVDSVGPCIPMNQKHLDPNVKSRTSLLVEVAATTGRVMFAVWVSTAKGKIVAEMNGEPISVNRSQGFKLLVARSGVEFWEFEADRGDGLVRISYDED